MSDKRRRSLYAQIGYICKDASMDREDRLEFMRHALQDKDYGYLESMSEIELDDLELLLDMLKGWRLVQRIRWHNQSMVKEAHVIIDKLNETAHETAERQNETGEWD